MTISRKNMDKNMDIYSVEGIIQNSKLSNLFGACDINLDGADKNAFKQFKQDLARSCMTPISTGFEILDENLNGGLVPSLYVIGAMPSLGKSTFMLNVAENIARSQIPVIYFSMEMPREYIARMILCHCIIRSKHKNDLEDLEACDLSPTLHDLQNRNVLKSIKIDNKIFKDYLSITNNMHIIERNARLPEIFMSIIEETVEELCDEQESRIKSPEDSQMPKAVLFVDYLQLLSSDNQTTSERSRVDKNITSLWSIANRFKIPVIVISSINRGSYEKNIDMSSFKESGGIEFSADIIFGLQYTGLDESGFNVNRARKQNPRKLNLKIIKNRYGNSGETINFDFHPRIALFRETSYGDADDASES